MTKTTTLLSNYHEPVLWEHFKAKADGLDWVSSKTCYRAAFGFNAVLDVCMVLPQLLGGEPIEKVNFEYGRSAGRQIWSQYANGFEVLITENSNGPSYMYVRHSSAEELKKFRKELNKLLGSFSGIAWNIWAR